VSGWYPSQIAVLRSGPSSHPMMLWEPGLSVAHTTNVRPHRIGLIRPASREALLGAAPGGRAPTQNRAV